MTFDHGSYSTENHSSLRAKNQTCEEQAQSVSQVMHVFTRRHFSPYKVLVNRRQRTVVILNPKVGTTCFRNLAARAYVEILGAKDASDGRYPFIKKARHFPFANLRDYYHAFSHPQEYDFYCFVRNPYARLKSAWMDKFAFGQQTGYPHSIRGKVLCDIRRFAASHDLPGNKPDSTVPFSTFISYVDAQEDEKRNHHWDVQHAVLMMDRIRYSQIYQMETQFTSGMISLFSRLGIPENWTKQAMQKPCNESKKIAEAIFTPELAKQAQRIYARDFQLLNYDINSWEGM